MKCKKIILRSDKSSVDAHDIEENVGDYFTQNTPLLDTYTGAAAAYSLRKLRTAYTGDAVEVYNGSSYAESASMYSVSWIRLHWLRTVEAMTGSYRSGTTKQELERRSANEHREMPKIYDGTRAW